MPNSQHRAAGPAASVSPYHLSAKSRDLLKQRSAEIRHGLEQSRQRRKALMTWPQVDAVAYPVRSAQWPDGCTHLPAAPARGAA